MTPDLAAVYEDLVALAATGRFAGPTARCRETFQARVGPFSASDPWFEERSAALWDRVLTDPWFLRELEGEPLPRFERAHREAAAALRRAQRGLFEARTHHGAVDLGCVVTGAAFRLAPTDDLGASLSRAAGPDASGERSPGLLDALVVPTAAGVAVLPGALTHVADATESVRAVVAQGRRAGMSLEDLLDALLAMRHRLSALSRMKPRQVYRPELLPTREGGAPA